MVKKYAGTSKQPIGFTIVGHRPMGRCLGCGIGAARPKRSLLISRLFTGVPVALARPGTVKADTGIQKSNSFQNIEGRRDTLSMVSIG